MNDEKKLRRFVGMIVVILVIGTIFVVVSGVLNADNWATLMSVAIIVSMAITAIVVARKRRNELKKGIPSEDERSVAIRMRAGYLAFYISLFFLLAMGIIHAILEDNLVSSIPTSEWLMVYVAVMGSIFLALNAYLSRKGVPR